MKLELSIPDKPGIVLMLPLLDLLALIFILPLMSDSLRPASGMQVELVNSEIRLPQHEKVMKLFIAVGENNEPTYYLDSKKMEKEAVISKLENRREKSTSGGATVVRFFVDKNVASGVKSQWISDLSQRGFQCEIVYKTPDDLN